jgi:2-iminobutanoate/2-iminopropanoate deaminase
MSLEKIHSSAAAPAAGPYSQAIRANGVLYVSGQIPADASGALIQDSITASTKQCCTNLKAILEEAGSSIEKVVRCGVYLVSETYLLFTGKELI